MLRSSYLVSLSLPLTLLTMVGACSGGSGKSPVDSDAGLELDAAEQDGMVPGPVPFVMSTACRYDISEDLGLSEGSDYECGDLIVYEDRAAQAGPTIAVHFVRFFSQSPSENATIYFEGGPGGNGSGMVARVGLMGTSYLDALLVDGDFFIVAQRGTSLSQPSLDCDDCSDRTSSLGSYNTAFNADDMEDLRTTNGIDKWNLYGISYGSRLALEVMRRHPEHIRSATIGGLVPSQINWAAGIPASFYSSITAMNDSCVADESCALAYGNLVDKFLLGVETLNDSPLPIADGFELDGFTYASVLFRMLYAKSSYPMVPMLISDLAERRGDRVGDLLISALQSISSSTVARGMYNSVVCGELFSPVREQDFEELNEGVPEDIQFIYGGSFFSMQSVCENWPHSGVQEELKPAVSSQIPTLVISGRMDPITPPSYGDLAAESLSNATVVVFENSGHGASVQTSCGIQSFLGFLADPSSASVPQCAQSITTEYILPSQAAAFEFDTKAFAEAMSMSPFPPFLQPAPPRP